MLSKQDIILNPGRTKNKNKIPQVDRQIQELENELRKLSPDGDIITEDLLAQAAKLVNDKIRTKDFSANEILFRRKSDTQQKIYIADKEFATRN